MACFDFPTPNSKSNRDVHCHRRRPQKNDRNLSVRASTRSHCLPWQATSIWRLFDRRPCLPRPYSPMFLLHTNSTATFARRHCRRRAAAVACPAALCPGESFLPRTLLAMLDTLLIRCALLADYPRFSTTMVTSFACSPTACRS